jgi:RimJ/RimL family protein N-acetyltransferase
MQLESRVLEDRFVRLEPLGEARKDELRAACADDPDTWERLYPYSMLGEHFDVQWARLQKEAAAGRTIPFGVIVGGVCRGMTTCLAIDPPNRSLEIGATYYAPEQRGGAVNPAAKRLLLGFAFEGGASRVQFRVDALNARSRAAVLKLGATQEGILRQDRVTWTGRVRDTVVFSILADEWPAVKARLDARLG